MSSSVFTQPLPDVVCQTARLLRGTPHEPPLALLRELVNAFPQKAAAERAALEKAYPGLRQK